MDPVSGLAVVMLGAWLAEAFGGGVTAGPRARSDTVARASTRAVEATRELVERLKSSGRAEASLERITVDPLTGDRVTVRGRLALEPPDRADLRFPATGERVTLRGDGGEWIQPELRQMIVLGPERAAVARRWWEILLPEGDSRIVARRVGEGQFLLTARQPEIPGVDSAWVWLDRSGYPSRLEIREEEHALTVYRFEGWRFSRSRGRSAFVIEAPSGFEIVAFP